MCVHVRIAEHGRDLHLRSCLQRMPVHVARAHVGVQRARAGGAGLFCGRERAFIDCVLTEGA